MITVPGTSTSLLRRLVAGEPEAWARLNTLYTPLLHAWLRPRGLQPADVDDLTQAALAVVLRRLPDFRHNGRKGAFRTWLRGILLNRLRDFRRQPSPALVQEGDDSERRLDNLADDQSELSRQWDREHDQNVVNRLLHLIAADFEPRTWQAFRAFVMDGHPAATVAAELRMSVGAVWSAKSHVLKRLRHEAREMLD